MTLFWVIQAVKNLLLVVLNSSHREIITHGANLNMKVIGPKMPLNLSTLKKHFKCT